MGMLPAGGPQMAGDVLGGGREGRGARRGGGRVDWHAEDHEETMLSLGLSSKREIARTRVRVRTAMATQTLEQGRYLGGGPPYGDRLRGAGPHPQNARAP